MFLRCHLLSCVCPRVCVSGVCVPERHSARWAHGSGSGHPSPCSSAASRSSSSSRWEMPSTEQCRAAHTGSGLSGCPDGCTQPVGAARPAQRRWQPSHLPHWRSVQVYPDTLSSRNTGGEALHSLNLHLGFLSGTLGRWPASVTLVFPQPAPPPPPLPTPPTNPAATPRGFSENPPYFEQHLTLQKQSGKLTNFKELCGGVFLSVSHSPPPRPPRLLSY